MKLKKSSLLMIVAVILTLALSIGSTLAYLTDTDEAVNTMVLGNVDIQQNEKFEDNQLLMPAVEDKGGPEPGFKNAIEKRVSVTNTGKNDAYVRTVFAFEMGSLTPKEFETYVKPVFNKELANEWYDVVPHGKITINNQYYFMMSVTRKAALAPGAETIPTLEWVYLDPSVDNKQMVAVDGNSDGKLTVIALSQGVQVEGFDDAETALNAAFTEGKELGTTNHPWLNTTLDDINDATYWYEKDPNADVFDIRTAAQLKYFAELVNNGTTTFKGQTVKLTADIDLYGTTWTPVGNVNSYPGITFAGTFDGQGHTIYNMDVAVAGNNGYASAGLFGSITGKVKNVTLDSAKVFSTHYAGGIVGYSSTNVGMEISNCHVKNSTITSQPEQLANGSWDNGDKAGGIIGYMVVGDVVKNCTVTNTTIQAYRDLGGIVGNSAGSVTGCKVKDVTLIVDNTHDYKKYSTDLDKYDAGKIIGENNGNESGNSSDNVKIEVPEDLKPVYVITTAKELKDILTMSGAAGSGNSTIELTADVVLSDEWTPVNVDGYKGADVITLNGNGHTIKGLTAPLFKGGFAGGSGIVINDLTIADSTIVSTNTLGSGAFIETVDSMDVITLKNCHLKDSSVTGSRTGGLIGWNSGYNNTNDGAVKTVVTIEDCTVTGCEITGDGTVGGIVGHAGANAWTWNNITNCTVSNTKLTSNDDSYRVGAIVGTANVGEVVITNCTSQSNVIKQNNKGTEIARPEGQSDLYGRFVPQNGSGKLTIDGVEIK